jgi:Xaa-Pro dipeptidase
MASAVVDGARRLGLPDLTDLVPLRAERGERLRDAMDDRGIDAVVLLDDANVSYATGITWPLSYAGRAGVERPVAVVLADDAVPHLFTPFLADAADELGVDDDHLHGPAYLDHAEGVEAFARTLATLLPLGATVAADDVSGAMGYLDADIVDAGPALKAVRRIKAPTEVDAIRTAVRLADAALAAAVAELRPGVTEPELTAACLDALAGLGVPVPARQGVACITSVRDGGAGRTRHRAEAGDLVAFHAGVLAHGYAGEVGRTWPVGRRGDAAAGDLYRRSDELWARLLDACRPGAPSGGLLDAYRTAGEPLPVMPIARGLGLGLDGPVVVRDLPETAALERLEPGVVLVVTGCVFDDEVGSVIAREGVHITPDGPEVLSGSPFWNRDHAGACP